MFDCIGFNDNRQPIVGLITLAICCLMQFIYNIKHLLVLNHGFRPKGIIMYTKLCRKVAISLENLKDDAKGISALEYAILAALIIGALALVFSGEDNFISKLFDNLEGAVDSAIE